MCELCYIGPKSIDRDSLDPNFSGFFSSCAIQKALQCVKATDSSGISGDGEVEDDEDGT